MQVAGPQGLLALRQLHTMTPYGTRAAYRARLRAKADLAASKALASSTSSSCSPLPSTPLVLAQLYYREAVWSLTARSRLHQ